jgi:colanic acid biosynthesis glycosyl transferase WcaI
MNILFITDNFYPEGNAIASRVYERACYWVKWGHSVTVITSNPNFPEGKLYPGYRNKWFQVEMLQGIRVIRVKTLIIANKGFLLRIIDFLSFMVPAFMVGLLQKNIDIIATTSPQFFGAIAACMVAKCKRKPFVLELGDLWPASIVSVGAMKDSVIIRLLEKIELCLYKMSTAIVVVSPAFKDNLVGRHVPANKINVILNGVDLEKYVPLPRNLELAARYSLPEDAFVVGYIGTHGMAHALANVLAAAALLTDLAAIYFIFVGAGAEREQLIALAKKMQLTNIQFIGAQPKQSINDYWSLCDVALVHLKNTPVFSEVIPSKIFEAMGMGLPILIAAPEGIASKIVLNEQVGLWVPPEDPQALAAALKDLYQQPELRKQLAENSLARASQHSREFQAQSLLETFNQQVGQA